jgi:hypothetical protein
MSTTISTYVEKRDAERLIGLAGGERHERGGYVLGGHHYWKTDEALMVALTNLSDANGIDLDVVQA